MSLVQVATETVTSAVASVTLTGIDSDDVYLFSINNVSTASGTILKARFTESGTPNTGTNYDYAHKYLKADTTFGTRYSSTADHIEMTTTVNPTSGYGANGLFYIYNANNSSEYTFLTVEEAHIQSATTSVRGNQGGGVFHTASQVNGIEVSTNSSINIDSGTFTLYRVV